MLEPLVENYDHHPEVPLDFAVVREAVRRNHYRTPFLLLDPELIRTNVHRFRAAMPSIALHYAIKANSHPRILRLMLEEHVRFEVASLAELEMLIALGVSAHEVHFNNPVKPREHVAWAARAGVAWYVIDTVEELTKIVDVKCDAQLCVRIETQNIGSDWPLTGKFGATFPEVEEILQRACDLNAEIAGVAFHVGSQCRNLDNWRIGIDNAKRVFEMMRGQDFQPRLLNIGGGFPVRHRKPIPSIEKIGASVNGAIANLPESIQLMAEPGRFLVSDCAWLITRVIGTAVRRGTRWIYLDTGVYHGMMEALGGLEYEIRTDRHDAEIPCTVAGPTCDSTDVIVRDKLLPQDLREGDYVYIPNAGAYTTAYTTHFNGFPGPDTVLLQQIYAQDARHTPLAAESA
ncbi:MAG TPA: type III PLP-dependent enzyme [Burkholderiales bacterium]|nr:type III PLP-dependent enzyme [Burkholderiales bacterium]